MKKVLSLFLALALCLSCFSITAFAADVIDSGTCGEELTWELTDDGTLTISGNGNVVDLFSHFRITLHNDLPG